MAIDQQFFYNRLGAWNPGGMVYALRRDVIDNRTGLTEAEGGVLEAGSVALRADKRPRPLVLRANVGDCLEIRFTNLLNPVPIGGQPADRHVGIHANGLELVGSINDDGSYVGLNPAPGPGSGLVAPGEATTYRLFAQYENTYLMSNLGVAAGGDGSGGTTGLGLFGAVNVGPSDRSPHDSECLIYSENLSIMEYHIGIRISRIAGGEENPKGEKKKTYKDEASLNHFRYLLSWLRNMLKGRFVNQALHDFSKQKLPALCSRDGSLLMRLTHSVAQSRFRVLGGGRIMDYG